MYYNSKQQFLGSSCTDKILNIHKNMYATRIKWWIQLSV